MAFGKATIVISTGSLARNDVLRMHLEEIIEFARVLQIFYDSIEFNGNRFEII